MVLCFDTETYLIQPGLLAPPLVCVSTCEPHQEPQLWDRKSGLAVVGTALRSVPETVFVGHNIAYDFAVLCAEDPSLIPHVFRAYREGRVRDTKLRQQLLDIQSGLSRVHGSILVWRGNDWAPQKLSLADLEKLYIGRDRSAEKTNADAWRMRYHELDGVPIHEWPADAVRYAKEDAQGTLAVYQAQGPEALPNEQEQVFKAWALHLVSCWGLRSDPVATDKLEQEARKRFGEVQQKLYAEGFYRLEPLTKAERDEGRQPDGYLPGRIYKSKPQDPPKPAKYVRNTDYIRERVKAALEAQGLPVPMTEGSETSPKQVKTDADTLEQTGDPLLMELGENGPIGTILRTFVPTLKRGTKVPINTRYNSLLETGRISSSDPNLNNIPRGGGVRECFVPRPGFVLCSVDFDCAELRALAQCCLWLPQVGFSKMAEFFQADPDGDPHLALAATILGITLEEAKALKKAKDPRIKEARQAAKALNFGYPGGLGVDKVITLARKNYGVIFTREQAQDGKRQWFETWPEMERYLAFISKKVKFGDPTVEQLRPPGTGPHRKRGAVGYCDGANGYFQGLVADAAGAALVDVSEECYVDHDTALFGSRPVGFLYDEILAEVPEDIAHEASFRMRDVMIAAAQRWIPDVPMRATPALMRRWAKDAETVYDSNGRLIPWEPKPEVVP